MTPLSAAGILQRLIDAGSVLGDEVDSVKIKSFLTWIESLRGYALEYNNLPDALALIRRMDGITPPQS